jgi:hypothetical protein
VNELHVNIKNGKTKNEDTTLIFSLNGTTQLIKNNKFRITEKFQQLFKKNNNVLKMPQLNESFICPLW